MPTEIYMMKLGMTMTEGTVAEWHIPDGGEVKLGEDLYRLETEKVEMEVEAEGAGIVKHLVPSEATVDPGAVIGYIFATGEESPTTCPRRARPPRPRAPLPQPPRRPQQSRRRPQRQPRQRRTGAWPLRPQRGSSQGNLAWTSRR